MPAASPRPFPVFNGWRLATVVLLALAGFAGGALHVRGMTGLYQAHAVFHGGNFIADGLRHPFEPAVKTAYLLAKELRPYAFESAIRTQSGVIFLSLRGNDPAALEAALEQVVARQTERLRRVEADISATEGVKPATKTRVLRQIPPKPIRSPAARLFIPLLNALLFAMAGALAIMALDWRRAR